MKAFLAGLLANVGMLWILNNRGEAGAEDKGDKGGDKTFTQEQLDAIVQERLARQAKKFTDYDELKKFKDEHSKQAEEARTKELEARKQYDELKKGWDTKEANYKTALAEREKSISGLKIDHALAAEVAAQNAYPEAKDVLRGMVHISEDGTPYMKGKDQVGNEVSIALTEGVKKFLQERPHLVKANQNKGGDTFNAGGGGGAGATDSLADLNAQLLQAQSSGNAKKAGELKAKINVYFASKGVNRQI